MINSLLHKQEVLLLGQKKHQWMEDGVFGEVVVQPVEEEARLELVQTLPQPMEELVVSENLVRIVTWMTVGEIQLQLHPLSGLPPLDLLLELNIPLWGFISSLTRHSTIFLFTKRQKDLNFMLTMMVTGVSMILLFIKKTIPLLPYHLPQDGNIMILNGA